MQFSALYHTHLPSNSGLEHFILWDSAAKSVTTDATDATDANIAGEIFPP